MNFRKKLLLLFAATVLLCVAVISASVYSTIRRSFEQANQERANAIQVRFKFVPDEALQISRSDLLPVTNALAPALNRVRDRPLRP